MEGYYQYGVGFVNENDEVILVKRFNKSFAYLNNTNSATRYFSLSANDFQNAGLDYGTYNVVPLFQYIDHEEWKVCQHESANYAIVNYSSNGISSSLHSNLQNMNKFATLNMNQALQQIMILQNLFCSLFILFLKFVFRNIPL